MINTIKLFTPKMKKRHKQKKPAGKEEIRILLKMAVKFRMKKTLI